MLFRSPTAALDEATSSQIIEAIRRLKGAKTILVVTHDIRLADACDVIYRMDHGQLTRQAGSGAA